MDIFERWFEQDLTKKVGIQHAESLAFSGNNASNVVGVYVYKDGAPAELAGTVTGTVIRPDGMTVPLTGTLSGNAVSAVLTEACFAVPGYIGVALTVTSGDITMTVLKATFEVEPIETSTVVDPSGEITANVAELISDIEAAVATIPPSYSDLLAAVAPTFDPEASTPYQSGAYVWYSGALYRFIADHTGAWTGTDAVSVNVGEEISEVKSAITQLDYIDFNAHNHLTVTGYRIQANGTPTTALYYNASPFIPVKAGMRIKAGMFCSSSNCVLAYYTTNTGNPQATYAVVGVNANYITETEYTIPNDGFIRFCSLSAETGEYLYFENVQSDNNRVNIEKRLTDAETLLDANFYGNVSGVTLLPGYIGDDGEIKNATDYSDVYSEKLLGVSKIDFAIVLPESKKQSLQVASYNESGYIANSQISYFTTSDTLTYSYTAAEGSTYIRFSFRTYDLQYNLTADAEYNIEKIINETKALDQIADETQNLIDGSISSLSTLTYSNGYIDANGTIHSPTGNKEIVSEPIYSVSKIDFSILFPESKSIWIAIAGYGSDGNIVGSRQTYSRTGTNLENTFSAPDGSLYVRISFRTFDATYTLSLKGYYSSAANSKSIQSLYEKIGGNSVPVMLMNQLKPCYDHLFVTTHNDNITIPSESIYHVRISKKLGFNVIEANVSTTSDGVFFVHHLEDDGTFGRYFHHVDGITDISSIKANEVTWAWISANVRYNSTIVKYRTRPCLLSEFLLECKKQELIPFVTSTDAQVVGMVTNIMGKDNFIAYWATRLLCPTAIIYQWNTYSTKEEIFEYCDRIGGPLIYGMSNINDFTDAQLAEIISALHEKGYFIAISYNDSNWNKYSGMGVDFNGTQSSVNRIESGNLHNIDTIFGFDNFVFTGATENNGVLTYSENGTLTPNVANTTYPVSMIDIELWFSGTITIYGMGEMKSNYTVTSDGSSSVFRTIPIINGSVKFSMAVTSGTVIYDIKYKASVC